jgi:hypothetical protein
MATFLSSLVSGNGSITAVVDNRPYTVSFGHLNYAAAKAAFQAGDADEFVRLVDVKTAINTIAETSNGLVEVKDDTVYYNGAPLHNGLTKRILDLLRGGFSITPMIKFLENLMKNPSKKAVDELYDFLENKGLSLTEDGHFLAYKCVRENYLDKHSGKFDNSPGAVLEMARNAVDDDCNNHCSYGFHAGSLEYSGPSGSFWNSSDKVVIVKINPADVVSVPRDYNCQKLRTCKYVVVGDFAGELNKPVYSGSVVEDEDYDKDEYSYDSSWEEEDDTNWVEFDDLCDGDVIAFLYEKDGNVETRHCTVESTNWDEGYVIGRLNSPETDLGQYRRFNRDKMSDIDFV